ncbi:hypothetical protein BVI1335_380021 [Burkholderia vietnamiensis]|nr:hypothetical protein BVI1335_380021 [Burkholderia vietnamiensis]
MPDQANQGAGLPPIAAASAACDTTSAIEQPQDGVARTLLCSHRPTLTRRQSTDGCRRAGIGVCCRCQAGTNREPESARASPP